jgi:LAGLIDADG endonuclease
MGRKPGGTAAIRARMAAAPGLSVEDANRLAGLLEAESHLGIVRNNRHDWRCVCAVALRDDDGATLQWFRDSLGLGSLRAVQGRNGSRPQVAWTIDSKAECSALVELLDAHPLRGRKAAQYEIWRQAVSISAAERYDVGPAGRLRLARLAEALSDARAYRPPDPDADLPSMRDHGAPFFFAGFFSGEGCFGLRPPRDCRFVIKVRRDDRPLLEAFRSRFGLGKVCDVAIPAPWSPATVWSVVGAGDVLRGIALFDAAGLLGRKQRQFLAWRAAAEAIARAKLAREPVDVSLVAGGRRALTGATAYRPPAAPLVADRGYADARTAYIDVLREWARSTAEPLSCTRYERARKLHAHWPKRDTIAFAFGGWYEALRCAGLEARAVRRPSAV